jgi:hypothetical protein
MVVKSLFIILLEYLIPILNRIPNRIAAHPPSLQIRIRNSTIGVVTGINLSEQCVRVAFSVRGSMVVYKTDQSAPKKLDTKVEVVPPTPLSHISNSSGDSKGIGLISSVISKASVPPASRRPTSRTNPNKMECLYQYAIEHSFDLEKFSIVTEAEKKRWDDESFRGILETDMRFYCGAVGGRF